MMFFLSFSSASSGFFKTFDNLSLPPRILSILPCSGKQPKFLCPILGQVIPIFAKDDAESPSHINSVLNALRLPACSASSNLGQSLATFLEENSLSTFSCLRSLNSSSNLSVVNIALRSLTLSLSFSVKPTALVSSVLACDENSGDVRCKSMHMNKRLLMEFFVFNRSLKSLLRVFVKVLIWIPPFSTDIPLTYDICSKVGDKPMKSLRSLREII